GHPCRCRFQGHQEEGPRTVSEFPFFSLRTRHGSDTCHRTQLYTILDIFSIKKYRKSVKKCCFTIALVLYFTARTRNNTKNTLLKIKYKPQYIRRKDYGGSVHDS